LLNISYVRADLSQTPENVVERLVWLTKRPRRPYLHAAIDACGRYLQLAGVDMPDAPAKPIGEVQCHVTPLPMAAIVNKSKRTLERLQYQGKLPAPAVNGGSGKADER
jgi:hypothetical protein